MNIETIGIPQALLTYRFYPLWKTFFSELGLTVIESRPTDLSILTKGDSLSSDESCLASKAFIGHVDDLVGRVDALFIPSYASGSARQGFCTKYQALPDMTANIFRDTNTPVVSLLIQDMSDAKEAQSAYIQLGEELGRDKRTAKRAYKAALKAQRATDARAAKAQELQLKEIARLRQSAREAGTAGPLVILVVAHPYISHDAYLAGPVLEALIEAGAYILFADETDKKRAFKESFRFTDTMPWLISRELIGSILMLQGQVDGIVLISAFPCGPDSMTNDAIMRYIHGTPILNLMIDAQSGTAGIQTRVESFMDILRFQQKGGYLHG